MNKLTPEEINASLAALNRPAKDPKSRWELVGGKLHRNFAFTDFVSAFGFMTQMALVAERLNHHPEWFNVYNQVRVDLTTHDASGITALDIKLATAMNQAC